MNIDEAFNLMESPTKQRGLEALNAQHTMYRIALKHKMYAIMRMRGGNAKGTVDSMWEVLNSEMRKGNSTYKQQLAYMKDIAKKWKMDAVDIENAYKAALEFFAGLEQKRQRKQDSLQDEENKLNYNERFGHTSPYAVNY